MGTARRVVAIAVCVSVMALLAPATTEAAEPDYVVRPRGSTEELGSKDQCYASVVGRDAEGQLQLSDEKCFETYGEVLADVGTPVPSARSTASGIDLEALATQAQSLGSPFVLATHFVDADYSGASFSISGNDCLGGGLTLGPTWDNKLSSTLNGCPFVAHYDNGDPMYSGRYQVTVDSGGNLDQLNDQTTAIIYGGDPGSVLVTPLNLTSTQGVPAQIVAWGTPGELIRFQVNGVTVSGTCVGATTFTSGSSCRVGPDQRAVWNSPALTNAGTNYITAWRDLNHDGQYTYGVDGSGWSTIRAFSATHYAAFGDSFAAGEGLKPYLDDCHRQLDKGAYPALIQRPFANATGTHPTLYQLAQTAGPAYEMVFPACSGAETINVQHQADGGTPQSAEPSGLTQLDAVGTDSSVDLSTITIGGNDVGFSWIITRCTLNCDSPGFRDSVSNDIDKMLNTLPSRYEEMKADSPESSIIVVGYPLLLPEIPDSLACGPLYLQFARNLSEDTMIWMNAQTRHMNDVIRQAAEEAGVHYIDPVGEFEGHSICGADGEWINGLTFDGLNLSLKFWEQTGRGSYHPNRAGQEAFARLINDFIAEKIRSGSALNGAGFPVNPAPAGPTAMASPAPQALSATGNELGGFDITPASPQACRPDDNTFVSGETATYTAAGFEPHSAVTISYRTLEDAETVVNLTSDASGGVAGTLTMPTAPTGGTYLAFTLDGTSPSTGNRWLSAEALVLPTLLCATDDSATVTAADLDTTIDVTMNDSVPGGSLDPTSVTVVHPPLHGTATLTPSGSIAFTGEQAFFGTDSLTYGVCDTGGSCATAVVTIILDPGCTITGTPGDDTLVGTSGVDTICGLGGNDLLQGMDGNDIVIGGDGDDLLNGGAGDDQLIGGSGGDRLTGGGGANVYLPGGDPGDSAVDFTAPAAPEVTATGGSGELAVNWASPDDGGSPISDFTIDVTPAIPGYPKTVSSSTTSDTITSATTGVTYNVTVTANNSAGPGAPASASATAAPMPAAWIAPTDPDMSGTAISSTVGPDGTVYVLGTFEAATLAIGSTTLTNAGGVDLYVAAYDGTTGLPLWATRTGSADDEEAGAIATDGTRVFITGSYSQSVTGFASALPAPSNQDAFVAAISTSNAAPLWAVRNGGTAADHGTGITFANSRIYVVGDYQGTPTGFANVGVSRGGRDVYVAALNRTSGAKYWAKRTGAKADDFATSVAASPDGVFVAGSYQSGGTAAAVTGFASGLPTAAANSRDAFAAKLSLTGANAWATGGGAEFADGATTIAVTGTNVYVGGHYQGTPSGFLGSIGASSGPADDAFVASLAIASGAPNWAARTGSVGTDSLAGLALQGGRVWIIGTYEGSPTGFAATAEPATSTDLLVATLDASTGGTPVAQRTGGTSPTSAASIASTTTGVVISGSYQTALTGFGSSAQVPNGPAALLVALTG